MFGQIVQADVNNVPDKVQQPLNLMNDVKSPISSTIILDETVDYIEHVTKRVFIKPRIDTNPECVVHYNVGIHNITSCLVRPAEHIGLPKKVATKEQPCTDFLVVQMLHKLLKLRPPVSRTS